MIQFKRKISDRFDAASNSYDDNADVQKSSAKFLIQKLHEFDRLFYPKTILDLGTGTGYVPEFIFPYYTNSLYTLNDISPKMIEKAKSKFIGYNNFRFHIGDMEHENFQNHELIISNFALQWVCNLKETIQKFYSKSKIFAFSCLLDGTFSEWDDILKNHVSTQLVKKYPTEKDLLSFCKELDSSNFYFGSKDFELRFTNARSFMEYLKNLGAGASSNIIPLNSIKSLITNQRDELTVTYKVFFGIIKREPDACIYYWDRYKHRKNISL